EALPSPRPSPCKAEGERVLFGTLLVYIALNSLLHHLQEFLVGLCDLEAILQQLGGVRRVQAMQQAPQLDDLLEGLLIVEQFVVAGAGFQRDRREDTLIGQAAI